MPPRKSNVSQITTTTDEGAGTPSKEKEGISVEDLSLPRTMVQRLAKGVLPPNTIIQKDAITAMSKAATVFVNYLSSHANDNTRLSSHKTITPKDVMDALREIEFEAFLPRLEKELGRYSEVQTDKRNSYRRKAREEKAAGTVGKGGREGGERARKRIRRGTVGAGAEGQEAGGGEGEVEGEGGEDVDAEEEGRDERDVDEEGQEEDEEEEDEGEGEGEGEKVDDEDRDEDEPEVDAQLDQELDDEALDNGEDSD